MAANDYRRRSWRVLAALLLAFAFQSLTILNNYMVARSIGLPPGNLLDFFAMLPIAFVVAMLPISIGGLGAREWAYFFLFTEILDYDKDLMIGVSILVFTCEVFLAITGGITYLFSRNNRKNETFRKDEC